MHALSFYALRLFLGCISLLGFKGIYLLAKMLYPICYHLIPKYRKRALSNLKLAKELNLSDSEIIEIAKKSLFHLLITALEYGKLYKVKSLKSFVTSPDNLKAKAILEKGQGVVFFCGHQSNWELLFLNATEHFKGVCIGKPIKNKRLYNFILSIRQKFQGRVIVPKDAYKGCLKALKSGQLVGIVGDQGLPESSFTYNCLGRQAHMTTLPALLSLRAKAPLFVATIARDFGHYKIDYSGPVCEGIDGLTIEELTTESLKILDASIKAHPEQWMWQHNRWKIPYKDFIPKKFRHDAIACVVSASLDDPLEELKTLKELYSGAYLILFVPFNLDIKLEADEVVYYKDISDCFITHFGPKLLFDTVGITGLKKHFEKQSLFTYIHVKSLKSLITSWKHHAY